MAVLQASEPERVMEATAQPARIRTYALTLLLALLLPVGAVFAFNLYLDPLLYRWPRSASLPQPAFLPYDREVHYNLVAHARARSLLLGNSQTQHGMRPADWKVPGPVINAAMVGADLPEIRRSLVIAQAGGHVDRAVVGIDITMLFGRVGEPPQTHEDFLVSQNGKMRLANLRGLLSFTLLRASTNALLNRYRRHISYFALSGQALDPLYIESVRGHGGTLGAMDGRLAQYEQNLRAPPIDFAGQLRALRDQACSGGTELTVYLTPLHARWIVALDNLGREGLWETWKRTVVSVSHERGGCGFEVWDFNTVNAVTAEPVPAVGVTNGLTASWDGVHFKPWVGKRILAQIATGRSDPERFGVKLTAATIDYELSRDRAATSRYRALHIMGATTD